ncbi:MAG TPA: CRTAC1 family protein [Bryobacteraceae bacterium]|nr:CRTAC1 family protein [Bryobacteraceae bacterium]
MMRARRTVWPILKLAIPAALVMAAGFLFDAVRATPTRPHFTNIAAKSKFTYRSNNNYTGRKYFPQPICGGVGILDYDQDGKMDIFFTNGAKFPELKKVDPSYYNCLLHNRGDGTFEDVTRKAGLAGEDLGFSFGVAVGDYDNDGYPDLFICNAGRNTLYHNNHDGTFTDVTQISGIGGKPPNTLSMGAAWFDYDNDGLLDLIVSNYTVWTPETDIRCGRDNIDSYCNPRRYVSVSDRLYHNLGNGKFADVTEQSGIGKELGKGMGIGIADFNQDGWLDVFVANDTERNFLFLNQGNGTFKEVGLQYGVAYNEDGRTVSAMGSDVKDYDNDGWVDIFYNNLIGQIWALFHNQQGRVFHYVSNPSQIARLSESTAGWSAGFIDYNNDGWKDLYSANGDIDNLLPNARQHDTMFENVNGKTFQDVSREMGQDFLFQGFQRGSAFADLNNDGFQDIVVTSLNEPPRILMNSADNGNHWLLLDLRGTVSARDAIGANVKVTTPSGRTLYNHVSVSVGFLSSSDRRVHFGLGSETTAETVEIHWPRGAAQTLKNVAADRILKIEEPDKILQR